MEHSHEPQVTVLPPNKEKIKKLWTVAGILGIITAIEFAIAFSVPHGTFKTFVFVRYLYNFKVALYSIAVHSLQ